MREIIHTSTLPKRASSDADAEQHDVARSSGTTGFRAGAGVVAIISALRAGTRHRYDVVLVVNPKCHTQAMPIEKEEEREALLEVGNLVCL